MSINPTMKFLFACLLAVCSVGCSSGGIVLIPISGRVIVENGGSPTQGEIIFTSNDYSERAGINVDGTFQLKIPKGNYQVFFLGTTIEEYASSAPPTHLIPTKYTDLMTTDLTLNVQRANDDVTIQVPAAASE